MLNAHFHVLRRQFLKALAAAIFTLFLPRLTHAAPFLRQEPLGFLDRLPKDSANYFADDVRLLVGWVTDAAAVRQPLHPGDRVDRTRSFRSVFNANREAVMLATQPFSNTMRALQMSSASPVMLTPVASIRTTVDWAN